MAYAFAESLMMCAPWALWKKQEVGQTDSFQGTCVPATPYTLELVAHLEACIGQHPGHPGFHHLYVHTMELSDRPGLALASADALRSGSLSRGGHLVHMARSALLSPQSHRHVAGALRRGLGR